MYPPRDEIIAALVAHLRDGTRTIEELADFIGDTPREVNICLDQIRPVIDDDAAIAYALEGIEWEMPSSSAVVAYRTTERAWTGSNKERLQERLAVTPVGQVGLPKIMLDDRPPAPPEAPLPPRASVAGPRQLADATNPKQVAATPAPVKAQPNPRQPLTGSQLEACLAEAIAALQERAGFLGRLHGMSIPYLHNLLHQRAPKLKITVQQVERQVVGKLVTRGLLWVCPPERGGCWHLRGDAIPS